MSDSEAVWYLGTGAGQPIGPLSTQQVLASCQRGEVGPETLSWREGFADWRPLAEIEPFSGFIQKLKTLIAFDCACGNEILMEQKFAGRKARCQRCGAVFTVPPPVPAGAEACAPESTLAPALVAGKSVGARVFIACAVVVLVVVIIVAVVPRRRPSGGATRTSDTGAWAVLDPPLVSGRSEPVRAAASLYRSGKYAEAYRAITEYIDERMGRAMGKFFHDGPRAVRTADMPEPEAYLLRGQLELVHADKITVNVSADAMGETFPSAATTAADSFDEAINLDPNLKKTVVDFVSRTVAERLAAVASADALLERAVREALPSVQRGEYAAPLLLEPLRAREPHLEAIEASLKVLARFDEASAATQRVKVPPRTPPPEEIQRFRNKFYTRLVPELVASLKSLTEADLQKARFTNPRQMTQSLPHVLGVQVLAEAELPDRAVELFDELLRCRLIQGRHDPGITRRDEHGNLDHYCLEDSVNCYEALVAAAVRRPDPFLPRLLQVMGQSSSLTLRLVQKAPGERPAPKAFIASPVFGAADSEQIWRAAAAAFSKVVCAHYAEAGGTVPDPAKREQADREFHTWCIKAWPGIDITRIAEQLVKWWPDAVRDDDFAFALAWHNTQTVPSILLRNEGYAEYGFAKYMSQFPNGRHADAAARLVEAESQRLQTSKPPSKAKPDSPVKPAGGTPSGPVGSGGEPADHARRSIPPAPDSGKLPPPALPPDNLPPTEAARVPELEPHASRVPVSNTVAELDAVLAQPNPPAALWVRLPAAEVKDKRLLKLKDWVHNGGVLWLQTDLAESFGFHGTLQSPPANRVRGSATAWPIGGKANHPIVEGLAGQSIGYELGVGQRVVSGLKSDLTSGPVRPLLGWAAGTPANAHQYLLVCAARKWDKGWVIYRPAKFSDPAAAKFEESLENFSLNTDKTTPPRRRRP